MKKTPASLLAFALFANAATAAEWYTEMQIGPAWSNTFSDYHKGEKRTAALKGILLDFGDNNRALFDTETLRLVTAYSGGIEWAGTPWTGAHGDLITLANKEPLVITASGPGWADADGSFEDKREFPGYGNLSHATYQGYYRHGSTIVFDYKVHDTPILETISHNDGTFIRNLKIGKRDKALTLVLSDEGSNPDLNITVSSGVTVSEDSNTPGRKVATIPVGDEVTVRIGFHTAEKPANSPSPDFAALLKGGDPLWPDIIEASGTVSSDTDSPYVTDQLGLPTDNPWGSNIRLGGFDFIDEDTAALCTWNGDVWTVKGLKGDWSSLKWQRIASGLFEPLGVKVVGDALLVHGRDQITQLIDLNGDGEIDHFKTFNRDILITENFHEFSFELQTDKQGNFYIAKAAPVRGGGRGFDKILPHNGVVAKISPDGSKFEVIATGLRAPGGLGVGPNGEITTGENEGTWQPRCKINFATAEQLPVFWGTEDTRQFLKDAPYFRPLCYLPMEVDNSGASQIWIDENSKFGLNPGEFIHLSYGTSSIYRVLPVQQGDVLHGGVAKLPIQLASAAMRARFHQDGSLYVAGFRGWQTNAASECAFQRVRYNPGTVIPAPEKLEYTSTGVKLTFAAELDEELATDPSSYSASRWNYVRGPMYGSGEFSVDNPDVEAEKSAQTSESQNHRKHDTVPVEKAELSDDGKTVELTFADMKPSHQLSVSFDLETEDEDIINNTIYATIHEQ